MGVSQTSSHADESLLSDEARRFLGGLGHGTVLSLQPTRWGFTKRTAVAAFEDGHRLVLQAPSAASAGAPPYEILRALATRLQRAGVPHAPPVGAYPSDRPGLIVSEFVDGSPGPELMRGDASCRRLAIGMGELVRLVAAVPADGLGLPDHSTRWRDLQRRAFRSLAAVDGELEEGTREVVGSIVAASPGNLEGRRPVFSHGDYCPANVLVRDGSVRALVDFDRCRVGDPLLDVAWWGWTIWFHHPDRWPVMWPAFLAAASPGLDEKASERMRSLVVLRCLEDMQGAAMDRSARVMALTRLKGAAGFLQYAGPDARP